MLATHPSPSPNRSYHAYMDQRTDLEPLIERATPAMVDLRHDLHAHPELSFAEHRTTAVIRDRLLELGWTVAPSPTETGAIATLSGTRPGRRVLVRADIDGLPVQEERDLSYRSTVDGVMHACGHDVHTAALLGVADVLAHADDLPGSYTLLFQPAEEGLGGARAMIDSGVLLRHPADVVIGGHVTSLAPTGFVGSRAGIAMSEATAWRVDLEGRGGHGAMAGADGNVVLALSQLASRLGEVVEGLGFEGVSCACSAGILQAGTANNVVPRTALLRGSLRTFTGDQLAEATGRFGNLLDDVERAFAVRCTLSFTGGTPAVVNDASVYESVMASARGVLGDDFVLAMPPTPASDDVSEFLNRVPGCYIFVGGALADGTSGSHHGPDFAVDDASVAIMAHVLSASAIDLAGA